MGGEFRDAKVLPAYPKVHQGSGAKAEDYLLRNFLPLVSSVGRDFRLDVENSGLERK